MADSVKRKHLFVPDEFVRSEHYTPPIGGGGGDGQTFPVRDRANHANRLLAELENVAHAVQEVAAVRRAADLRGQGGVYIQFTGSTGFELPVESLAAERSGIALLNAKAGQNGDVATIFVPVNKLPLIEKKIAKYRDENFGATQTPKNQNLVANIETISLAQVVSLWTDDLSALPDNPDERFWAEVWLRTEPGVEAPDEIARLLASVGLGQGQGEVEFPERRVVPVFGSSRQFGSAMLLLNSIAELRRAKDSAAFFHAEPTAWQEQWVGSLTQRLVAPPAGSPRVCLLDTGVNDHPLLLPVLAQGGKHVNNPAWGVADQDGHGTNMAGLCTYGDLADALLTTGPFLVGHQLESVKVLRHGGDNQGRLLADITREGVGRAEVAGPNLNRAFVMALSATDTRDRGRPTTWSAMVDKLASGADDDTKRLIIVAGGNVRRNDWIGYPNSNATESIHDPGQSWNALTVGAYTQKDSLDAATHPGWEVVAPQGELGPSSCTSATWAKWPVKPDIVMEGGNAARNPAGSVDTVPSLDVLTTNHQFIGRPLQLFGDTSAAAALAGRFAGQLYAAYPELWPETVRGLMVHSAEWTPAMLARYVDSSPWTATKTQVRNLMRHCGHGVPSMDAALWSVENELTLVYQGELQPFDEKFDPDGGRSFTTRDMNLHEIPWPTEALEALEEAEVELRVTLSYFIEPNPAERGWTGRYRYQSHGLRFAVKKGSENVDQFRHRVNGYARAQEGGQAGGSDTVGWLAGETTRNLGSIHSDRWRGTARELAERGLVAVYPTIGWWRERPKHERWNRTAKYALAVSIRAPEVEVDLFANIANQIEIPVEVAG